MTNRLYASGEGETLRFHSAPSQDEVRKLVPAEQAETVRVPNPDDLRALWRKYTLSSATTDEIARMFSVSRQAVCLWRKKAGIKEEFAHIRQRRERDETIKGFLSPDRTASEVAKLSGCSIRAVRRAADAAFVTLRVVRTKRPDDAEIVRLAAGKTWRELAAACGVELASLRQHVYANPTLAEKVRRKIVREGTGTKSHGKIDVDQLVALRAKGLSAYQIARHFGVETPSVQYWVRKLQLDGSAGAGNQEKQQKEGAEP